MAVNRSFYGMVTLHVLLIRFQLIHFYHISPKNPCFATWDDILRLHSRFYQIISDHANSKQKQEEDHMLTKKLHASDSTVLIFLLKREAPIHWQCLLAISLWLYRGMCLEPNSVVQVICVHTWAQEVQYSRALFPLSFQWWLKWLSVKRMIIATTVKVHA